jgi:hypothetical protein
VPGGRRRVCGSSHPAAGSQAGARRSTSSRISVPDLAYAAAAAGRRPEMTSKRAPGQRARTRARRPVYASAGKSLAQRPPGPGVPSVGGPCLADWAADGDDRVSEVEERVDDLLAAFVAALQPVEGVVPGVGPLDVPALPGLDRGFSAFRLSARSFRVPPADRGSCASRTRRPGAPGCHRAAARARRACAPARRVLGRHAAAVATRGQVGTRPSAARTGPRDRPCGPPGQIRPRGRGRAGAEGGLGARALGWAGYPGPAASGGRRANSTA